MDIYNYYEPLVIDRIRVRAPDLLGDRASDHDLLEDIACLALNRLPTRYVRHQVDTTFYLSTGERNEMMKSIEEAVEEAVKRATKGAPRT